MREWLILNHYLHQLDDAQVTFGVKQQRPEDLHTAVQVTLKLESYLLTKPDGVASVEEEGSLVAVVRSQQDTKLETHLSLSFWTLELPLVYSKKMCGNKLPQ